MSGRRADSSVSGSEPAGMTVPDRLWSVPVPDDSPLSQPEDKYEERMCKAIITLQHDHFGRIYMACWEVTD